ncbi:glutamate racemase [Salipaludibacillus agaradhaerens]|uniref:glutamate racemase n=1 Tax=Salipaludibacillus agaradhaerens TaxID=76935 RepID=UPI000997E840|nr:glutamate racemase [Salipaludibacillus agaradhaerens]MCR6107497.1 glutamate racemase [Salipaludibacillus agaradhaerens]MCR6119526.1 glutamate racemase [Salipaludibacillus agaradhaerens]UJW58550.1 glutamate racemase [Bacillus sp. A116_S68]
MKKPIGVIDSGVGGLTVVSEIIRQLPKEEIIYIGDTARCPYGPRTEEEVRAYTWEMIDYLTSHDIKLLVIACNTATAVILEEAKERLSIPVLGVIHPGATAALKVTTNHHVGVIGTEGTISSGAYHRELTTINDKVKVVSLACPTLVPLVETGEFTGHMAREIITKALAPILQYDIDSLILGCTHYPLLAPLIEEVVGSNVKVICSGDETALEVSSLLYHKELLYTGDITPHHIFYTTGLKANFKKVAEEWLKPHSLDIRETDLRLPIRFYQKKTAGFRS